MACITRKAALNSVRSLALLITVSVLLSSCGFGPYRPFPNHEEFPFGIRSEADLYSKYGQAKTAYAYTVNSEVTKQYCYLGRGFNPFAPTGVSKTCYLLWKDSLVGYQYAGAGTSDPDAKDVTLSDLDKIVKGVTTKPEVIKLLGQPNGIYHYPLVKDKGEEGFYYVPSTVLFMDWIDNADAAEVVIVFNKMGIVIEVTASGRISQKPVTRNP